MITDAILGVFFGVMQGMAALLPEVPNLGLQSYGGIWYGYAWFNSFLPLTELLAAVGIVITFHLALYGFLLVQLVRRWLPFI